VSYPPAVLALADGTVFRGESIGADGVSVGEVVFNTAMTGYQEILTDPSYCKQIVTLTYPHIGNVGVNAEDVESRQVFASGLVIRDLSMTVSNFRSTQSLQDYLQANNVVAIAGIDTRKLTRILREKGAQNGCIASGTDEAAALKAARGFAGLEGMDLAKEVLAMEPDGVFLSNGPGDPEPCDYAIKATKKFIEAGVPLFGICLGHQIMGLAVGAKTMKMKFGHRGANHPVQDMQTRRVMITSQNHGFAVDAATLPKNARATHVSLFDGTLQGFELTDKPAFCFQGHPEASPGPHDVAALFDRFVAMMEKK